MTQKADNLIRKIGEKSRSRVHKQLKEGSFDLCIIGGGIHGAWMARDAATRGLSVALLEARDYGSATSSRSSKMLHGGVRYLERGDVSLVFDALKERARCVKLAGHLCSNAEFLFPTIKGKTKPTWMVDIGLGIYDLMARVGQDKETRALFPFHKRLGKTHPNAIGLSGLGLEYSGLLHYYDGQMNDVRLVTEVIKEARSLGATCLNYAEALSLKKDSEDWQIDFEVDGERSHLKAKCFVNAAGPWVKRLGEKDRSINSSEWPQVIWSRGIHLLFDKPWTLPGVILPTGEPGRYYFIWPWEISGKSYTLVGTTDQRTDSLDKEPVPNEKEVAQLINYLKKDLPDSGLGDMTPQQSFCGVRTLASKGSATGGQASQVSRKEIWVEEDKGLHLVGGKYTNARGTAEKGIDRVCKMLGRSTSSEQRREIREKPLAGSAGFNRSELLKKTEKRLKNASLSVELAPLLVSRYGVQVAEITDVLGNEANEAILSDKCLRSEVYYTVEREQAITVEDIVYRRLNLGFAPYRFSELETALLEVLTGAD